MFPSSYTPKGKKEGKRKSFHAYTFFRNIWSKTVSLQVAFPIRISKAFCFGSYLFSRLTSGRKTRLCSVRQPTHLLLPPPSPGGVKLRLLLVLPLPLLLRRRRSSSNSRQRGGGKGEKERDGVGVRSSTSAIGRGRGKASILALSPLAAGGKEKERCRARGGVKMRPLATLHPPFGQ